MALFFDGDDESKHIKYVTDPSGKTYPSQFKDYGHYMWARYNLYYKSSLSVLVSKLMDKPYEVTAEESMVLDQKYTEYCNRKTEEKTSRKKRRDELSSRVIEKMSDELIEAIADRVALRVISIVEGKLL